MVNTYVFSFEQIRTQYNIYLEAFRIYFEFVYLERFYYLKLQNLRCWILWFSHQVFFLVQLLQPCNLLLEMEHHHTDHFLEKKSPFLFFTINLQLLYIQVLFLLLENATIKMLLDVVSFVRRLNTNFNPLLNSLDDLLH